MLCICGMFNNIKLSSCGRNHCLNCSRGGPFLNIYDKISISMIRSSKVRYEALEFVSKTFDNENFIAFHMRTSDTVSKKPFTEVYLGYTEAEIYNSIIYLANKFYISHDNIFLACPPSALKVKDVKLFNTHLFKKYKNNKNLEPYTISLIEQEICSISTIFIRSITNTPHIPKKHIRSSWGTGVDDFRVMYHFNLNDISIDKLVNDYKTNDRKSYIKYDQLDKKEQKEYSIKVFDFFNKTQTFKSLDTNKILLSNGSNEIEISNEKINQKILNIYRK